MLVHARHYQTGESLAITVESDRITAVGSQTQSKPDIVADWVAPSFFDIQVNGSLGISFNSPALTTDDVHRIAEKVQSHGVGGFCPTLYTTDSAAFEHGFGILARGCD